MVVETRLRHRHILADGERCPRVLHNLHSHFDDLLTVECHMKVLSLGGGGLKPSVII